MMIVDYNNLLEIGYLPDSLTKILHVMEYQIL